MAVAPHPALAPALRSLALRYDRAWLSSDPLHWPRAYSDPGDREVAAVVAALLAYGRVASIDASVGRVLSTLGARPARALAGAAPGELEHRLGGFRHRWTAAGDVAWLLEGVSRARARYGSLGALVSGGSAGAEPLRAGLAAWRDFAHEVPAATDPRRRRAREFLLPDPYRGGACKRLLMLARWCVRPDDGLDLGLWHGGSLRPRDLVIPLDVHVFRIARQVGLTSRRTADWKAAVEVTEGLRALSPEDPVRFDFAMARPGILGKCRYRFLPEVCGPCDLRPACSIGSSAGVAGGVTSRSRRSSCSPRTTPSPSPSRRTPVP